LILPYFFVPGRIFKNNVLQQNQTLQLNTKFLNFKKLLMNFSTQLDFQQVDEQRKKVMGKYSSFLLFLLFGFMSFFANSSFGQSICPDISKCNAKDVKIASAFIGDANGQPVNCVAGTSQQVYLYIVVSSNATRQGLRFAGTITTGGVSTNVGGCFPESLKGTRNNILKYPTGITWTCGDPIRLSNIFIAWTVGQTNICNNPNLTCDQFSPQCYTQPPSEFIPVEIKPLGVAINFGSPAGCSSSTNKTINFSATMTNGTPPYTYEWDFGDNSAIDNTATPTHQYSAAGTYKVTLNVTDATGKVGSSSQTITVGACCTGSVMPTSITASPGTSVCAGTQVTLTQQGGSLGTNAAYKWYTGSCGGTLAGTGNSIIVSATATTTYYVRAEGTCGPTNCQQITITINSQPTKPATACYETATFDASTCQWVVTGTQPTRPTTACYETATFNTTSCQWAVTGTQPTKPATACYETATFNTTSCQWEVTGTQPTKPATACYEAATFNTTSCQWVISGTQPTKPTTACYETATFNTTSCQWVVTGTQPTKPTTACYETATFNTTSCQWVVMGTQPTKPATACYETATFNTTSCQWVV
jgi:PKD repeat protein